MFRKYSVIILLAVVLLPLSACKKGKAEITLQGFVHDNTFDSPLSNQKVELYEVTAGTSAEKLIGTIQTDALGFYSFTFSRDKAEKYYLRVSPANYFPIEEAVNFDDLSIEDINLRNLSTTAKAWVKLVFTNSPPANSWDNLRFTLDTGKTGCEECLEAADYHLYGEVDTIIHTVNDGNTLFRYYYVLESTPLAGYKSATTNAFDTTAIFLEY